MGWKGKLICILVIFFAGFATAIYCLAPVSQEQAAFYNPKGFPYTALKSDRFAKSFDVSLHKFVDFSKDTASRIAGYAKRKAEEKQQTENLISQEADLNKDSY